MKGRITAFDTNIDGSIPLEHRACWYKFNCRADMQGGVMMVYDGPSCTEPTLAGAVTATAEFVGWHATTVWEKLNGFRGYDNVQFYPMTREEYEKGLA